MTRSLVAGLAILITACSGDVTPPRQALLASEPEFLKFDDDAYAAAEKQARVWAVKGETRVVVLRYSDPAEEFLRFTVGAQSLAERPDGTRFEAGDSVEITVRVEDDGRMVFRFSPSGLKFDDAQPAILRLSHARANPDLDGNGTVNLADAALELEIGVFKQELPGLPWLQIPSLSLPGDLIEAEVHDFTGFGMATN
ncbi:MAG: hypothetical protein ACT443_11005 [Gemmatimonadota bacterium]